MPWWRISSDFMVFGTTSGRVVSRDPNIVNIPRDKEFEEGVLVSIRNMIEARPGWEIISADFSQIEFRVAALVSGDKKLIRNIFDKDVDIHTLASRAIFGVKFIEKEKALKKANSLKKVESLKSELKEMRVLAKMFNFGRLYGGSDMGLADSMGLPVESVREFAASMDKAYPDLARFIKGMPQLAWSEGYIQSPMHRIRRFPPTWDRFTKSEQGRQAINFIPQSVAAYICRKALNNLVLRIKKEGLKGFPINIVYDNILAECPKEETSRFMYIMAKEMLKPVEELSGRFFTIEIGKGKSWREAEMHQKKVTPKDLKGGHLDV